MRQKKLIWQLFPPFLFITFISLLATKHPPIEKAGRNLLWAVFGFGVTMLLFAFSKNYWFSLGLLFFSGVFDGISVVIRRSLLRLLSPEHLRGRIAAANWIFICSSNELGAFESGLVAAWIGTIPCVALGGVVTLLVVAAVARFAPELRRADRTSSSAAPCPSSTILTPKRLKAAMILTSNAQSTPWCATTRCRCASRRSRI